MSGYIDELVEQALTNPNGAAAPNLVEDLFGDHRRVVGGGTFILDASEDVPCVWGRDDSVLWAAGEPLYIVGPAGVGKTTLMGQLVFARIGLADQVLDWPVEPGLGKLLYLACDRPQQIARAFRRLADEADREILDEQLAVWKGPPPGDIAAHPEMLLQLAQLAGADTIVVDSLKDVAIGISNDEVGAGLNNAVQRCIAAGIEVAGLHHQRKGQDGKKPKTLEDVYGSTWIPAGAGSVILLWGQAGDPLVEFVHLKQPAGEVGPLRVEHDHNTGRTSIFRGFEILRFLRNQPNGTTANAVARQWFEKDPNENECTKARRKLDNLVKLGHAFKRDGEVGGAGGSQPSRYFPVTQTA